MIQMKYVARIVFCFLLHSAFDFDGVLKKKTAYIILSFSGFLCGVRWFETDVLGLPIISIFKGHAA